MATDTATKKEKQAIRAEVDEVLKRREKALRARAKALAEAQPMVEAVTAKAAAPTPHMKVAAAMGTATKGWVVAEGDSWFACRTHTSTSFAR